MKLSRLRGATLASLAFLASGQVHAQMSLPMRMPAYPGPAQLGTVPMSSGYPMVSQPGYVTVQEYPVTPYGQGPQAAVPSFAPVAQPPNYGWQARPIGFGATNIVPEPSVSVLGGPPATKSPVQAPVDGLMAPELNGTGPMRTPFPATDSTVTPAMPYGGSVPGYAPWGGMTMGPGIAGGPPAVGAMGPGYGTGQVYGTGPATGAYGGYGGGTYGGGAYGSGAYGSGAYGSGAYGGGAYGSSAYGGATGGAESGSSGASCASGAGFNPCATAASCGGGGCGWYVGLYSLILTANGQNHYTFSYDDNNEAVQHTDAKDTHGQYGGGFAVSLGHFFNCGQNALELVYWAWLPDDVSVYTYGTNVVGNLNGILNWDSLTYNGAAANTWVDNAQVHGLFRDTEVQNLELNVLQVGLGGGGCSRWQFSGLGGIRYFRLHDHLIFGADTADTVFDGDASEIFYDTKTINSLVGLQVGGVGNYSATQRLALNAGAKFGVYANYIDMTSSIGGPAGFAVINNGPNAGTVWNVSASKQDMAFLGELFLGGTYCFGSCFSASAGYRAIALTGVGLPTEQIYPDLRGINDVYQVESGSGLLLHGAYVGANFCF